MAGNTLRNSAFSLWNTEARPAISTLCSDILWPHLRTISPVTINDGIEDLRLLTEIAFELRECVRQTEIDRRLRRDRRELPIRHPLTRDKDTHRWQPRTHNRSSEPDAERQHGRVVAAPTHRPIGVGRSQEPFIPEMKCENRLEFKGVLR